MPVGEPMLHGAALSLAFAVTAASGPEVTTTATTATRAGPVDRFGPRTPKVWLGAVTDFPVQVGGRAEIEIQGRLRAWTSLGVLPVPYVEAINAISQAVGGYDEATGDLIVAALSRSLVWRTHLGWRPWKTEGFTVDAGYGLATLGGDTRTSELAAVALGASIPTEAGNRYDIDSTLHQFSVELGWRFLVWRGLSLRTSVGLAATVGSSTAVTPATSSPSSEQIARSLEAYLDDVYTRYVHFPYVGLEVGYGMHELTKPRR